MSEVAERRAAALPALGVAHAVAACSQAPILGSNSAHHWFAAGSK